MNINTDLHDDALRSDDQPLPRRRRGYQWRHARGVTSMYHPQRFCVYMYI